MTIGELVQRVQSLYSKGVYSDDSRLSNRHIFSVYKSIRTKLLREKHNKRQRIVPQTLSCVELINVPVTECSCVSVNSCKIKRSKYPLIKPITSIRSDYIIFSVSSLDGKINFSPIQFNTNNYLEYSKYAKKSNLYYILNDYLYLSDSSKDGNKLEIVTVTGLFEEIFIPSYFKDCGCSTSQITDCTSILDQEFPIDGDLLKTMIELAQQEILEIFPQMIEDKSNNASDFKPGIE